MAAHSVPFRITTAQVNAFAQHSQDTNPLHVDSTYAATTPYGGVICHGALAALSALDRATLPLTSGMAVEATFTGVIYPDMDYQLVVPTEVADSHASPDLEIAVRDGHRPLMKVRIRASGVPRDHAGEVLRTAPSTPDLEPQGLVIDAYAPDLAAIRSDLHPSGGADQGPRTSLPTSLVLGFAAVSYIAGMHTPGRQALLRSISVTVADREPESPEVRIALAPPSAAREARGMTAIDGTITDARGTLVQVAGSALRRPITTNSAPVGLPSDRLHGRVCVVVGSSRGLGWALARELDHHGATVIGIQRSTPDLQASSTLRIEQADARDDDALAHLATSLSDEFGGVDALVLAGTGTLRDLWIDPQHLVRIEDYVMSELALLLRPLAHLMPIMRSGGQVVYTSSSVLGPDAALMPLTRASTWPHYAAAKAAGEATVRVAALENSAVAARILRLPALATSLTASGGLNQLLDPAGLAHDIGSALFIEGARLPFEVP